MHTRFCIGESLKMTDWRGVSGAMRPIGVRAAHRGTQWRTCGYPRIGSDQLVADHRLRVGRNRTRSLRDGAPRTRYNRANFAKSPSHALQSRQLREIFCPLKLLRRHTGASGNSRDRPHPDYSTRI
jgi:hypothetical protein